VLRDNASAAVSHGLGNHHEAGAGQVGADRVAEGMPPAQAASRAMELLGSRLDAHGGILLLDARGRMGLAHNTPRMAWAWKTASQEACGISCPSRPEPA
jgi:beta-aspartyl-peptidase (threonine type)